MRPAGGLITGRKVFLMDHTKQLRILMQENFPEPPLPRPTLFKLDDILNFCAPFRDPTQYPQLQRIGHRWDKAIELARTKGAVTCIDPMGKIFLVESASGLGTFYRGNTYYRVDLKVKRPAISCTCPDDRRNPGIPCKHRLAAVIFLHHYFPIKPGDLVRVINRGPDVHTATALDVYANWVYVDIDERRGFDNHRSSPFTDDQANFIFKLWLEEGEKVFLI
jgi:hypothetical protein